MRESAVKSSIIEDRSVYYTTILSHLITSDGKYLLCSLKSGKLAFFPLIKIIEQNINYNNSIEANNESISQLRRAQQMVKTCSPIYSMALTSNNYEFVCGAKGELQGWKLEDNNLLKEWTISLASNECMVNSIVSSNDMIFSGCGDNNIYGFDVETHKQIMSLSEHKDYINCIILSNDSNVLYSGSEDGSVRVWDLRSHKESVSQINPFKNSDLSRPNYGKWIGALALTSDDWLICGGGPHLSLWHLNSLSAATKFEVDCTTNIVECHNDYVISGGNASNLYVWEMNGELRSSIPTSASDVFSIKTFEYKDNDIGVQQVISAAGMSHKIDICTNFKYKDFELLVI